MPKNKILFLHGLGSSSTSFDLLKQALAPDNVRFASFDCAGHVRALHETYEGDPLLFAAEKIAAVIEKEDNPVSLVGHSMGGALALLVAQKIPGHVQAVLSIEGNLIAEDCGLLSRGLADAVRMDVLLQKKEQILRATENAPRESLRQWAKDIAPVPVEVLKDYAASLVRHSDSGLLLEAFHAFAGRKAYIHGDDYAGHPVLQKLGAAFCHDVKGAGHFVMQDDPSACAQIIRDILL